MKQRTEIVTRSKLDSNNPRVDAPHTPLYVQIANRLITDIGAGKLAKDGKLPTEAELIQKFNAGRVTIRQALDLLKQRNLIESFPGRGTFLKGRANFENWQVSTLEDLAQMGLDIRTDIIEWGLVEPTIEIAKFLKTNAPVYQLRGVRYREVAPLHYIECNMLRRLGEMVDRGALETRTPIELFIKALNVRVERAREEVWAEAASEELAKRLQIRKGAPVLVQRIDLFGEGEKPLQSVSCYWRSDQFKRGYELRRA